MMVERFDLVVRDSELLVTMGGEEISGGWVAVRDGLVAAVGRPGEEPEAVEVVRATGCLVTPGLINTHHHMFQNLTRSFAPSVNRDVIDWVSSMGQMWTALDEEAVYTSTWIALAELALGGCTTSSDQLYAHPRPTLFDAQVAAARDIGMRFHPVRGAMDITQEDGNPLPTALVQDLDTILADNQRVVEAYHDRSPNALIQVAIGTCTTFDCSPRLFEEVAAQAERLDVRMHTHLEQSHEEKPHIRKSYGRTPFQLYEDVGWASDRAWVAHCIFPDNEEIALLARWGTGVAHCPSSNMILIGGAPPVRQMLDAGVTVGLGVDGSASNDTGSLWLEARTALMLAHLRDGATAMTAREVLEIATLGGARCLGREGQIGVLQAGANADIVAWPLEGPAFAGAHTDLVEAWLRCGPVSARHTIVGGQSVVRDGHLTSPALDEQMRTHGRISRDWQRHAGLVR